MRIKKPLQTAGVTLLGTALLLLVSSLLFLGVWALLPDRTEETHSYAMSSLPAETPTSELYPWDRMTAPWEDGADALTEEELFWLLDPILPPQLSPYTVNWNEGEFLCDESRTLFGIRNLEILMRSHTTLIVDKEGYQEFISDTESILPYRFSFAFRERYGSTEICFVGLEPPPRAEILPAAEEAGLAALRVWLEKRNLDLESGSPFAAFLWRFTDLCVQLEGEYDAYNAALILYETGSCEITREGTAVYCTFKGNEGEMTLLYDPVGQTVYGISLQRT